LAVTIPYGTHYLLKGAIQIDAEHDVLMGVIRRDFRKISVSERAALGLEGLDLAGFQQLLPMTLVAFFCHRVFFTLPSIFFLGEPGVNALLGLIKPPAPTIALKAVDNVQIEHVKKVGVVLPLKVAF
jgi:hypothetical protein